MVAADSGASSYRQRIGVAELAEEMLRAWPSCPGWTVRPRHRRELAEQIVQAELAERSLRGRVPGRALAEVQAVNDRAWALLGAQLTPQQRHDLDQTRSYLVVGSSGRRWRVHAGMLYANVALIDDDGEPGGWWWCLDCDDQMPEADVLLAQTLLLRADDQLFCALANPVPRLAWATAPPSSAAGIRRLRRPARPPAPPADRWAGAPAASWAGPS